MHHEQSAYNTRYFTDGELPHRTTQLLPSYVHKLLPCTGTSLSYLNSSSGTSFGDIE